MNFIKKYKLLRMKKAHPPKQHPRQFDVDADAIRQKEDFENAIQLKERAPYDSCGTCPSFNGGFCHHRGETVNKHDWGDCWGTVPLNGTQMRDRRMR